MKAPRSLIFNDFTIQIFYVIIITRLWLSAPTYWSTCSKKFESMKRGPSKKYPNKALTRALKKLNLSAIEFARSVKLSQREIENALYKKIAPHRKDAEADTMLRLQIQLSTGLFWNELFPNDDEVGQSKDLPRFEIELTMEEPANPAKEVEESDNPTQTITESVLETLPNRERIVLKMLYFDGMSLRDAGNMIGVTAERVRQIEARALRLLRHPMRMKMLISTR